MACTISDLKYIPSMEPDGIEKVTFQVLNETIKGSVFHLKLSEQEEMRILGESCPMTIENCERYGISDSWVRWFCHFGCSVICSQQFLGILKNRREKKSKQS